MLNTSYEIITEVLVRNNRTTTDSFITDAMLAKWYSNAYRWACGYKKWPFTEGRVSTTFATEECSYPEGWKTDSIRFITVGGDRYQKLNYEDYNIFRDEEPDSDDKVFSDYARIIFVNPNSTSGTLIAYGQYTPICGTETIVDTADTGNVFSYNEEEGNEAIVEKMSCYLKRREHLAQEAELHDKRASDKLEEIWKKITDEQFSYHSKNRGMFERIDVINGTFEDDLNTDQF